MDTHITYRRTYDEPWPSDGTPVLVDRIWPRGVRKEDAGRVAARHRRSTELHRWYSHKPDRFTEFRRRYLAELTEPQRQQAARHLRQIADQLDLTLLTATRDLDHSQAAVLAQWLDEHPSRST